MDSIQTQWPVFLSAPFWGNHALKINGLEIINMKQGRKSHIFAKFPLAGSFIPGVYKS